MWVCWSMSDFCICKRVNKEAGKWVEKWVKRSTGQPIRPTFAHLKTAFPA